MSDCVPFERFDLLPSSLCKVSRGEQVFFGIVHVKVYCQECGKHIAWMGKEYQGPIPNWASAWCAEHAKPDALIKNALSPDEHFFYLLDAAMREEFGRPLTALELDIQLANPDSTASKLARDRFTTGKGRHV